MTLTHITAAAIVAIGMFMAVRTFALFVWPGFIDLDTFKREHFSDAETTDDMRADLAQLRARYGTHVPRRMLDEWVRGRLREAEAKKARILAEADARGATINLEGLRQRLHASGYMSENALAYADDMLQRLEQEHGPEIPVSVVAREADRLTDQ